MSRPFNTSHSTNIGRRSPEMELLRSWCMSALRRPMSAVLVTVPGGQDTEAQMHAAFAHLRIGRSEWFHVAPDLMDFIDHLISQQAA